MNFHRQLNPHIIDCRGDPPMTHEQAVTKAALFGLCVLYRDERTAGFKEGYVIAYPEEKQS